MKRIYIIISMLSNLNISNLGIDVAVSWLILINRDNGDDVALSRVNGEDGQSGVIRQQSVCSAQHLTNFFSDINHR